MLNLDNNKYVNNNKNINNNDDVINKNSNNFVYKNVNNKSAALRDRGICPHCCYYERERDICCQQYCYCCHCQRREERKGG